MTDEHSPEIMPLFVACQSLGGYYDDESFCAGFDAGYLYAQMKLTTLGFPLPDECAVRTPLLAQLDLLAMQENLMLMVEVALDDDVVDEGWTHVRFRKVR